MLGQMNVMPLAMMMAGVTMTATVGKDAAERVINTVKVGLTEYELSGISMGLKQDYIYGEDLEELSQSPADFSDHIRESMEADKGRDPSFDLWNIPYALMPDDRGDNTAYVVYSLGPNKADDACSDTTYSPDGWQDQLRNFDISEERLKADAEMERPPSGPDDVCHTFKVSPTDRSPYKRIK
ncbi:MAG: hypothetical protein ACPGU1_17460 [Myxococcota bacterium]